MENTEGAFTIQLENFIRTKCAEKNVSVDPHWDYFADDIDSRYNYIKEAAQNGKPVIWGIHDNDGEQCTFYGLDDKGNMVPQNYCSSHYVTATGVYERYDANGKLHRYIEVSNGAKKQYVDYEDYLKMIDVDINGDASTFEKIKEFLVDGFANDIGNGVMMY